MGLYDRSYYQDQPPRFSSAPSAYSAVTMLIVANFALYFADFLFGGREHRWHDAMSVTGATITQPWMWWKFVTYGFAHDPSNLNHIVFNMLGLFFFGRPTEQRLGKIEFLRFYFTAIVLGGLIWSLRVHLMHENAILSGASGAVVAVTMLFIFWYPHVELLLFFIIPVKAWIVGALMIAGNLFGLGADSTAFDVHLVGIGFASAYYYFHWNLAFISLAALPKLGRRRPSLRLHNPDQRSRKEINDEQEAERILQKIYEHGESSLTNSERKTLERHSRRLRERR